MAYIPPHKRHPREPGRPMPTPESLSPQCKRNVQLRAQNSKAAGRSRVIIYSNYAISRWFAIGLDDGNGDAPTAHLKEVSVEPIKKKPFILVENKLDTENKETEKSPWSSIAENVLLDLLSSFEKARAEGFNEVKPALIARFGNILFHVRPSVNLESAGKDCVTETNLREMRKTFYTTVPASYAANIMVEVPSKIGVNFTEVKDVYYVKLFDSTQPDTIVFCKFRVNDDKKLQLYKVELKPVRDMIIDMSCLDMNLDLRLGLSHKRILTSMTEDEIQKLRNLIDAAIVDPDVKGGLRWPSGKA